VLHGFSQVEVAAVLGISPDAARKRYQRALRRLRKVFENNFDGAVP
jgi:DNA-directed RNA polymerase specialized sigma24 family protein